MSEELDPQTSAAATEAPESPQSAASYSEQSAPAGDANGGFDTPFSAFRHLPEFQGQDDLAIAQNLYKAFSTI